MFRDLIDYALNPFPWHLAPMGYVREVRMTGRRGASEAQAWASHLAATRAAIEAAVAHSSGSRKRAVVVGAGNLLDIPLAALARGFDRVDLVDIYHPRSSRALMRGFPNVRLIQVDVTGVARAVFRAARSRRVATLPKPAPPPPPQGPVDLIVSVNLLSQLSVIPCSYLQAHCPRLSVERLGAFAAELRRSHLDWLSKSGRQVCLITDVTRIEARDGGGVRRQNLIGGVDLPALDPRTDRSWDWHIAPRGGVYADRDVQHRVHAYLDL